MKSGAVQVSVSRSSSQTLQILNNFLHDDFGMCSVERFRRLRTGEREGGNYVSQSSVSTVVNGGGEADERKAVAAA